MDRDLTAMEVQPQLQAPAGAWDSHIHILDPRFPMISNPVYQPPVATVQDYQAVQRRLNLQRVVVVQSSTHGTDHACLLDAIRQLGPDARGVGMVDATVSDAELLRLTRGGVRGARCLMTPGGVVSWDEMGPLAARVAAFGWHINLQFRGDTLAERYDTIARLPGPVVIDHMGRFGRAAQPTDADVRLLMRLLDSGRVWVKLSAPYAGGTMGPPPYRTVRPLARALVRHAPERLVWGSDWPHTFMTEVHRLPPGDDALLLDLLLDWVDDDTIRRRILVDTPEALFGTDLPV